MRVTGGKFRGVPIKTPGGKRTRPTSDKVRQALFNVLGENVACARTLDLFAGSGALAIEALSRGAESAVLVEKNASAARTLRANIEKIGLSEKAKVFQCDFRSALTRLSRDGEMFDIIFIDPPYEGDFLTDVCKSLQESIVTTKDSIIVVEHFSKTAPPDTIAGLSLANTRAYGQTTLSYYFRDEINERE
jgi:16S rRNA (guanine(966)-N(2))-methyltransferase RsmD